MKKHLLILALTAALGACSSNPDPEYAPDAGNGTAPAAAEASAPVAATRLTEEEAMRLGRETTATLFAQDIATLWPRIDPTMREGLESPENFAQSVARVFQRTGPEARVVSEEIVMPEDDPGTTVYQRRSQYHAGPGILTISFHADGSIKHMNIRPDE